MGTLAFIARLIPVFSPTADLLYEQINMLTKIIHDANGVVYSEMSDNLRANQSMLTLFQNNYGSKSIYSVNHPVPNIEFDVENIYTGIASWRDLVSIYQEESESIVKETTLSFAALYPTNFEKQCHLPEQGFYEKTVTGLELQDSKETARFVQLVLRMWKCWKIKSPDTGFNLSDEDWKPFVDIKDLRMMY